MQLFRIDISTGAKVILHDNYQKQCRSRTVTSLKFVIQDCKEVISAFPENINNGFYQDEICYCVNELNNRILK